MPEHPASKARTEIAINDFIASSSIKTESITIEGEAAGARV